MAAPELEQRLLSNGQGRRPHLPVQRIFAHGYSLFTRWVMLCALVTLSSQQAYADPQIAKVSRIKAAFVYNIAKFVSWPSVSAAAPGDGFMFCFYREDFLGRGFESIRGKRIQERRVEKRVIDTLQPQQHCDVVLIPASQLSHYQQQEATTPIPPQTLTIADLTADASDSLSHHTAMVNLVRAGSSIGFEVNLTQVRDSGLTMSSELLKLARILSQP